MRNAKKQLKQKTSLSFVLILLALVCAFALSGCGGGGGGGGANMGGQPAQMPTPMPGGGGGMTGGGSMDPPATIPTREQALEDQTTATNAVSVIARAAQAQPNPGSVTQSSNVDSNNTTTDQVEVTAEHGTGVPRFSLRNGSEWSLGMNEGNPLQISDAPSPWKGVALRERINAGVLYIDVYTDIAAPDPQQGGGPDTDYLVGGIWLFVPGDASSVADYAFGAFSDGSDPFRQNNLTALQGTARYEGNAIGVATDTTDEVPVNTIGGDVVLTADFGGAGALGTIGGSITNLYDDEPLTGSLNLGAANIGSSHNGFFIGEVSGSVESRSYTGNWSGQFFGNGETGGMPGSVAGTLSGGSTDGIVNFVGAYGAHRPSSSPMSGGRNILVDALEADAALAEGADIRIRRAAKSRRTFGTYQGIGHTTQSSYSFGGQTNDKIAFTMEYDANGDLHYTRTRRLADNTPSFSVSTKDAGAYVERFSGSPAAGWKGVEGSSETDARDAYTAVYSDIRDNADTDYLAYGIWLVGFKDADGIYTGFRFGTAASGNDPFSVNNLAGLTGSATYAGPASGMYMSKASSSSAPEFDYFDATARLTANFGDATALGSVTGAITGGSTDGGGALPSLTLGSADITNSFSGGNFDGETSGGGYSGKWAAKFYGNGAGATEQPGSIAGTFGANSSDNLRSILGSFGAYKQ